MSNRYAAEFTFPTRATSTSGSHVPPRSGAGGFDAIFTFLRANHSDGTYTPAAPTPSELPGASCDSFLVVVLRTYWWFGLLSLLCCGGGFYGCFCCCCKERLPACCRCEDKREQASDMALRPMNMSTT